MNNSSSEGRLLRVLIERVITWTGERWGGRCIGCWGGASERCRHHSYGHHTRRRDPTRSIGHGQEELHAATLVERARNRGQIRWHFTRSFRLVATISASIKVYNLPHFPVLLAEKTEQNPRSSKGSLLNNFRSAIVCVVNILIYINPKSHRGDFMSILTPPCCKSWPWVGSWLCGLYNDFN